MLTHTAFHSLVVSWNPSAPSYCSPRGQRQDAQVHVERFNIPVLSLKILSLVSHVIGYHGNNDAAVEGDYKIINDCVHLGLEKTVLTVKS